MTKKKEQHLVIVESPAKAKTIGKILGPEYVIESSVGHIRDLPVRKTGVNTRKNFEPDYVIMPGKEKVVERLQKLAAKSDNIYLATDPDREGEAIAWHLMHILDIPEDEVYRVAFNEITETAIKAAFKSPGDIDSSKVNAQQARRILDRLVGYKISPLIRRKIGGKSAGRVQSVAVRLICDREAEIEAFQSEEYWSFEGSGSKKSQKTKFPLSLISWDGKRIVAPDKVSEKNQCIRSESEAAAITGELLPPQDLTVSSINERTLSKKPSLPFVTSTLQRSAASAYGYGVKKTMQVAQQLYEGVDIYKNGSPVGLITYMRTDSTRISDKAQDEAKEYILNQFGEEYYPEGKKSTTKKKGAQDAHEAIRPTYVTKTPAELRGILTNDQYKLYKLIWERFVASQMESATFKRVTIEFKDTAERGLFRTSAQKPIFKGYMAVWQINSEDDDEAEDDPTDTKLPDFAKGDTVDLVEFVPKQHFTEPPPRFNEASLVKTLEELGIGRPSTYAATISTVIDRDYVIKNDSKALQPTKLGKDVNEVLLEHFPNIVNTKFTASMESQLDQIENEGLVWQEMLREFYEPFKGVLKEAQEKIAAISEPTDYKCETCDAPMVKKSSFYGPFLACSKYPDCKTTEKLTKDGQKVPKPRPSGKDCTKCGTEFMITYGRYGEYLQCPKEECGHRMPIFNSTGINCYKEGCSGEIVEKKSRFGKIFFGCSEYSNTKCDAVFWNKPIEEDCPDCSHMLTYKFLKRGDKIACPVKECGYARLATETEKEKYGSQA